MSVNDHYTMTAWAEQLGAEREGNSPPFHSTDRVPRWSARQCDRLFCEQQCRTLWIFLHEAHQ